MADQPTMASLLQGMPTREDWDSFVAGMNPYPAWSRLYDQAYSPGGLGSATEGTMSPQTISDALQASGGAMTGGFAVGGAPEGALGSAGGRLPSGAPRVENPIRLYQGGPHDIQPELGYPMGRLRDDKLGSGEGAHVYGYGHYGAEAEDTAKSYKESLAAPTVGGQQFDPYNWQHQAAKERAAADGDQNSINQAVDFFRGKARISGNSFSRDMWTKAADALANNTPLPEYSKGGHMYEWAVHADPNQFLDWDKPGAEQPDTVKAALLKHGVDVNDWASANDFLTGDALYRQLGKPQQASQSLKEAGIPGIRYLDQMSRRANTWNGKTVADYDFDGNVTYADGTKDKIAPGDWQKFQDSLNSPSGKETRNYVIFDPRIVDIVRKYGMAGLLGSGLMGQMASGPQQDGQ